MPASGGSSDLTVANSRDDVVRVGDIGRDDPDVAAMLFAEGVDALLRGLARVASTGQHQMLGTVGGQVSGDFQSDRAQSTGHQICCVIT